MDDTDIRTLKHKQSLNVSAIDGAVLLTQSVADSKGGGRPPPIGSEFFFKKPPFSV